MYIPRPGANWAELEDGRRYVDDELRRISQEFSEQKVIDLRPSYRAIDRPREGAIIYADGASYDPGYGEGPYIYKNGVWLPFALGSTNVRDGFTSDREYYIRTNGSNNNTGRSNTAGGAWLTPAYGVTWLRDNVDTRGYKLVLNVADGTYTSATRLYPIVGSNPGGYDTSDLVLRGNTTSLGNVLLSVTNNQCVYGINVFCGWRVEGFEFRTAGSGAGILADFGTTIYLGKNRFGTCASLHIQTNFYGSKIELIDSYEITGGAAAHWYATNGSGILLVAGRTVTTSGTPAFAGAFAFTQEGSSIFCAGGIFAGSGATGKRFNCDTGAGIQTNGAGSSFLPGSVAGTVASPGWYA